MSLDDPVVIESGLSQDIEVEGYSFEVCIYRLEEDTTWTLEVIDEEGTSHIWDGTFVSDFAAMVEAQKAIRTAGAEKFMYEENGPTLH
jgi:hypothetical protein